MQSFSGVFIATHTVRPQVVVESTCEWKKSNNENPMQCPSSSSRAIWMAFPYYVNLSRPFPINTQKLPSRRSDGRLQHGSRILSPELPIYSLFACTLNVHEIGEPEVAKGSSSQFFAIHRRFTVAVVVVVVINWSLRSPQPATCEFRKMTVRLPRWGVSSFRWFHCVAHLCAELPSCRLIHGIYFIRRLCTLLAIIRCTFLCCARSTSRPVQWPVDTVGEHNFIHNVEDEKWRSVVWQWHESIWRPSLCFFHATFYGACGYSVKSTQVCSFALHQLQNDCIPYVRFTVQRNGWILSVKQSSTTIW